uniref:F-box associated domain-containing protein n=1 Tax=Aegilops tauschii TaxID=37682 RepID=M8BYT2_AEGTA
MILELCNPIAGKSHRLPALKSNRHFRIEGCALLTGADCCPAKRREAAVVHSSFFKVIIIAADRDEPRHSLHVFTSTESGSSWSTPRECLDSLELEHGTRLVSQKTSALVCQGVAHWLFRNTSGLYTLSVCAKTTEMSLTRLPVKPDQTRPILGVTDDGAPPLLRLDGQCTMLEIWTRRSDNMSGVSNTDRWHRTKMIELQPHEWGKMDQLQCVCAGETSGILLIKDKEEDMYIVDLQTGAMEAVTSWFHGIVMMAIPFKMDWPAFFTRRLANTSVKRTKPRGALSKIGGVLSKIADPFWGPIVVSFIIGSIAMSWAYIEHGAASRQEANVARIAVLHQMKSIKLSCAD